MTTATSILLTLPRDGERSRVQFDVSELRDEERVPAPKYRHAAPSAPWPWMDFDQDVAEVRPLSPGIYEPWSRYPQSHFGNWTPDQVQRSRMLTICKDQYMCQIHNVDVLEDGTFGRLDEQARTRQIPSDSASAKEFWDKLLSPLDSRLRVRALFIENITVNVLQMLGARYNIEPSFFASSANWIPSRYQEDPLPESGDHITVVLPFIRTVNNQRENLTPSTEPWYLGKGLAPITDKKHTIDTQAPLVLSEKVLIHDLLAIHMIRNIEENVIISYHYHSKLQKTTAKRLQSLVQRTGDSVYWQKLYRKSQDPTFVFLAILWYALYAWDEALEVLYAHLNEKLESSTAATHIKHTRELHKLQAHLLHYQQLLRDFAKSVEFVRDTLNPAMAHKSVSLDDRESSVKLLAQESDTLLYEIMRLEKQRQIQSDRLQNATRLHWTEASMLDAAAMKQISYLTIIFLPATYLASVFGMNVAEMNPGTLESLGTYIVNTVILTVLTIWVVVALREHSSLHQGRRGIVRRLAWPIYNIYTLIQRLVDVFGKAVADRWRR